MLKNFDIALIKLKIFLRKYEKYLRNFNKLQVLCFFFEEKLYEILSEL